MNGYITTQLHAATKTPNSHGYAPYKESSYNGHVSDVTFTSLESSA